MIKFKISEDVKNGIKQISPYGKIVGDWDFMTLDTNYNKFNLIKILSLMLNITGSSIQDSMSMLYDKNTKQIEQWEESKGTIIDWLNKLNLNKNKYDSNPFDYSFSIYLEAPDGEICEIKKGGEIMLIYDIFFSLSLSFRINIFSEKIIGIYNNELGRANRLHLGEKYASYNREVLADLINRIRNDFGVIEPTTFESECMAGICDTGFTSDCSQFRF